MTGPIIRSEEMRVGEPLEVTYVLNSAGIGGGPRVVFFHLDLLAERGHKTALYMVDEPPKWHDLKAEFRRFDTEEELVAALAEKPGIKVATWWETAGLVMRASEKRGTPVFFVQDIESSYYRGDARVQAAVMRTYEPRFNYLSASGWVAKWLDKLYGYKVEVIPPAVDLEVFRPRPVERKRDQICAIHRTNPLKNFDLTIEAFRRLRRPARLVCFGQYFIGERNVTFLPSPSDEEIVELFNASALFIQTSRHEGFGMPLVEAMACGCPVVTTDANGNMVFCEDEKNCLVVPMHDAALVARTTERLMGDEELQERLRRGGLETAKRYTWESVGEKLEKYYLSLAGKG